MPIRLKSFITPLLFSTWLFISLFVHAQDSRSFSELNHLSKSDDESVANASLDKAYRVLDSFRSFTEKTNSIAALEANYRHERTIYIIMSLLDYNYIYNNPDYKESIQKMYENDIVVEKLVRILGKNGNPRCFPSLLNIVIHPNRHRDATVNAAFTAMTQLKW